METGLIIVLILVALSALGVMIYDLFFKKNPEGLTNLEKRYVEKAQSDLNAAESYIKEGAEKIRTKV